MAQIPGDNPLTHPESRDSVHFVLMIFVTFNNRPVPGMIDSRRIGKRVQVPHGHRHCNARSGTTSGPLRYREKATWRPARVQVRQRFPAKSGDLPVDNLTTLRLKEDGIRKPNPACGSDDAMTSHILSGGSLVRRVSCQEDHLVSQGSRLPAHNILCIAVVFPPFFQFNLNRIRQYYR